MPVKNLSAIQRVAGDLLSRVLAQVSGQDHALRRLDCVLYAERRPPTVVTIRLARASRSARHIGELLRQLRGTGATVLIAEQNMHFCLGLASHATVIDKGQIVYTSGIEELKANENIRQRYLAL